MGATPKIEFEVVTLTPDQCASMLRADKTKNRQLSKDVVRAYARDMKAGNWEVNGEAVVLNGGSSILNGQHRLAACVEAGVPFTTAMIKGAPKEVFASFDQGYKRSFANILDTLNVPYATTCGAITASLYRLKAQDRVRGRLTPGELMPIFRKNQKKIVQAASTIYVETKLRPLGSGALGTIVICGGATGEKFLDIMKTGVPAYRNCPVHLLRETLLRLKVNKTMPNTRVQMWTAIGCFNHLTEHLPMEKIRWTEDCSPINGFNHKNL